jgi:phage-related protein
MTEMWIIEYYETPNGDCPTKEFLNSLDKKIELPHAIRLIGLLEQNGPQLKRPYTDFLEKGIYELRIRVKHMQYRILYFYFFQDKIILSHGLKKEKKVPKAEIEKALKHKTDYIARHERKK